jgi:hypothetical protein
MSLATIMLEQLAVARRIVDDGEEMTPAWRIETTEGAFLILTRFDTDKPEQRERALFLIKRFRAWKMATGYVVLEGESTTHTLACSAGEPALRTDL